MRDGEVELKAGRTDADLGRQKVQLAREEVDLAQDRFSAGVTDNIEVTTAQDELARANEAEIAAFYRYNLARATLARAVGPLNRFTHSLSTRREGSMSNTAEDLQQMEQPTLSKALTEDQVAADAFRKARTRKTMWAASATVFALIVISFVNELRNKEPLVDLKLLGRRNFGFGSVENPALGRELYGVIYILPVYLGQEQGYSAYQVGNGNYMVGSPTTCADPIHILAHETFRFTKTDWFRYASLWRQLFYDAFFNKDFPDHSFTFLCSSGLSDNPSSWFSFQRAVQHAAESRRLLCYRRVINATLGSRAVSLNTPR